jgi:hypothetical protein
VSGAAICESTSRVRHFFAVARTRWSVIQISALLIVLRVSFFVRCPRTGFRALRLRCLPLSRCVADPLVLLACDP